MFISDNGYETKENKNWTKDKIEPQHIHINMYVVVQFYSWFNFYFPLILNMILYDHEYKPKESKSWFLFNSQFHYIKNAYLNLVQYRV